MRRRFRAALAAALPALAAFAALVVAPQGAAQAPAADPVQTEASAFDLGRIRAHLEALEAIADAHGGDRAAGTSGGRASAAYIAERLADSGLAPRLRGFPFPEGGYGFNVLARLPGRSSRVVLIGAHFDSVPEGPGLGDNGSGVAMLLELARILRAAPEPPAFTLDFAFWDAEELGLLGVAAYLADQSPAERGALRAYLNFDMVGTPGGLVEIGDGDKSSLGGARRRLAAIGNTGEDLDLWEAFLIDVKPHPQDAALEARLAGFFAARGMETRDDLVSFFQTDASFFVGWLPVATLSFLKEAPNAEGGVDFIPCYHQACDRADLVDPAMAALAGEAALHLLQGLEP